MDICAVANASDKVLEELGLTKAGDRLNLVAYCKSLDINCSGNITSNEESNKKRRVLLDAFLSRKKSTKTSRNKPANREVSLQQDKQMNKIKTKKVILGWKHFRDEDNAYMLIPLAKGGGSRTVEVPVNITRTELIKICKDLFYPHEQSIFGASDEMFMDLSNFKDETINEGMRIGDRIMSFNISNYMEAHKIKTVRVYLRTKKVSIDLDSDGEIQDGPLDSMFQVSELCCLKKLILLQRKYVLLFWLGPAFPCIIAQQYFGSEFEGRGKSLRLRFISTWDRG
jgi:hypothetical protein